MSVLSLLKNKCQENTYYQILSSRLCLQESQAAFNLTEEEIWDRGGRAGSLWIAHGCQRRLCELQPMGTGTATGTGTPSPTGPLCTPSGWGDSQPCTRVIPVPVFLQEDKTSVFLPMPLLRWDFNNQATAIQYNLRYRLKQQHFFCSTPCFAVFFQSI